MSEVVVKLYTIIIKIVTKNDAFLGKDANVRDAMHIGSGKLSAHRTGNTGDHTISANYNQRIPRGTPTNNYARIGRDVAPIRDEFVRIGRDRALIPGHPEAKAK